MHALATRLAFLVLATTSFGCANPANDDLESTAQQELTASRNQDVHVLKVYGAESFSISPMNSTYVGYRILDQQACKPEGKTWDEIKAWDVAVSGSLSVTLDCTEAFTKKYGFPSMRQVSLQGYRTRKSEEGHYGYVGFSNGAGTFWVKTVELAVKQSAIEAASFNGIGFYLNSFTYPYYQARPAPGPDNGNGYFAFATEVRKQANQYPAATLPSGEKVRIIKVLLPAPYALGGSSYVRAFYFRPFAEYLDGSGEKVQRWDEVASDYFIGSNTQFNREADVLSR